MIKKDELRSISRLSDDELLSRLSNAVKQSCSVESELVAHLGEVDKRRLYAREASSCLFNYCTDVLHLSEPVAQLRITAARASRRYPVILTMLEDGRIHLSAIGLLAKHLTDANYEEVLTRATHKSKRQIKELVAELAPKPDAPASIRKVPVRSENEQQEPPKNERPAPAGETNTANTESTSSGQSKPEPPTESAPQQRDPRAKVEPLSPASYIMAEQDYGKEWMDRYRRSDDCAREPDPSFELCPDKVPSLH